MSLEQKLSQLKKLQKDPYPSDQEIEEMARLEDEIKLEYEESIKPIIKYEPETINHDTRKPKTSKANILRKILFVKPKEPPKPVTEAELAGLTMEARKQEILARIARAKAVQVKAKGSGGTIFDSIKKVIGESSNNPFDVSSNTRSKKSNGYDPFRW